MLAAKQKLSHIEGLRGLAALVVVLHHYTLAFYPALNFGNASQTQVSGNVELIFANTPLNIIYNGGFAVSIFFTLSGYVLSNAYHKSNDPVVLIQYAIKRYFRLLVPVAGSVVIACLIVKAGFMQHTDLGCITKTNDWLSGAFQANWNILPIIKNVLLDVFLFKDNSYNSVLWTMTYELLGSFMVFVFLLLIHRLRYKLVLHAILILVLFFAGYNFYAAFILGALLNRCINLYAEIIRAPKWLLTLLFISGLFFSSYPLSVNINSTVYSFISFSFLNNYEFYHVAGAFMLLFVIINSSLLQRLLSGKTMVCIGKISFSFYLLHFILLCSLSCYLFKLFYFTCGYNWAVVWAFVCTMPVLLLISMLYDCFVDKQGIKLSEKILSVFYKKSKTKE